MGGRDLAVFVEEMAEEKPELWELASMMSEQIKDGASILRQYREDGAELVTNAPKCWTSPLHPTHDVRLEYHEVKSKNIADAITKVSSTAGDVHLAYRLVNRPTYEPMVALLMWQFEDSHAKFWLNCTSMDAEKMELATAILDKIKYVHDYAKFQRAAFSSFKTDLTTLQSIPAQKGKNINVAQKLASRQRRATCLATRQRVIRSEKDIDSCFLFHFALELDILCDYMHDERAGKV